MTTETLIEIIRFQESGLSEVAARTQAFANQVDALAAKTKALEGVLRSGTYPAHVAQMAALEGRYERAALAARNLAAKHLAATGQAQKQALAVQQLNRQHEITQARVRNEVAARDIATGAYERHAAAMLKVNRQHELLQRRAQNQTLANDIGSGRHQRHAEAMTAVNRQQERLQAAARNQVTARDLNSGAYFAHARAMAALSREQERLGKQARLQSLVAEHGRLGGILKANADHVQRMKAVAIGVGMAGVGMGMGLMRSGLQNTVTGYRLDQSWLRLSRQIAAVAIPAIEKVSAAISRVAGWFETLTGKQQNFLLAAGLVAAGVATFGPIALATAAAVASLTSSVIALRAAAAAGARTAAASTAVTAAATTGAATAATTAAAGTTATRGAAAGSRGAATAAGVGGRVLGRLAGPLAVAIGGYEAYQNVSTATNADNSQGDRVRAGVRLGGQMLPPGLSNLFELVGNRMIDSAEQRSTRGPNRRDVMPLQAAQEELGGAWSRIQEEVMKQSLAMEDEKREREEARQAEVARVTQEAANANRESAKSLADLAWDFRNWLRRQ